MSRTRLYLIRHGETDFNREGRYQGRLDVELSTLGKEQAQALAHRLEKTPFTAIYASNLKRAQATAQIIAAHHELPVQVEPDLRERDFGSWEGFTFAEIEERFPEEAKQWLEDPLRTRIPGAEDFAHLQMRVTRPATGGKRQPLSPMGAASWPSSPMSLSWGMMPSCAFALTMHA